MTKRLDITGEKYGRLTALSIDHERTKRQKNTLWKCICDCGNVVTVFLCHLRTGHTKSCRCLSKENSGRKPLPNNKGKKSTLYSNYRARAKRKNIEFSLERDNFDFIIEQNCAYCGSSPSQIIPEYYDRKYRGKKNPLYYNGLDRIDSKKGYTEDNCTSCCKRCNFAKHEMSKDDFFKHILKIIKHNNL